MCGAEMVAPNPMLLDIQRDRSYRDFVYVPACSAADGESPLVGNLHALRGVLVWILIVEDVVAPVHLLHSLASVSAAQSLFDACHLAAYISDAG